MKALKSIIIFIAVSILLIGCSFGDNSNSNGTDNVSGDDVVTVYMAALESDPNGMMEEARQNFNEEHDNIQVEFVKISNDASEAHDQTVTQLAAKSDKLDIVNLDIVWIAEFAEAGWLKSLDELFTEEMQEEYVERQVEAMKYNDNIWAVPWFNDLHPMWYRTDLLEKHNFDVPETYEDAVEISKVIKEEEGISGFSMHWGRGEQLIVSFTEFLIANNGDFYDENDDIIINEPEAVEALQFMIDMIEDEVVSSAAIGNTTPDDSRIPFTEGQALFNPNWGYVYSINQGEDSAIKDNSWVASNLKFEGGQHANALGGWNFAIAEHSNKSDEAWTVIEWFTSLETQREVALGGGQIGTHLGLYEDEEILESNPYLTEYLDVFEDGANRPAHPQYSKLSDMAQLYIHQALNGDLTAQEALDKLAEDMEGLE